MNRQITLHSNRIYEFENNDLFTLLSFDVIDFNKVVYHTYNLLFDIEYNGKQLKESIHLYLKFKYNIDDYYANSILRIAKAILTSTKELTKEYKISYKEKIKSIELKLKEKELKLDKLNNCLEDLHQIQDNLKLDVNQQKTNLKLKTWVGSNISYDYKKNKDHIKTKDGYIGLYSFEYNYILPKRRLLKANISKLKYALNNTKTKLTNLDKPKRICFGGAKFIKDNLNKANFKELLYKKKHKEVSISGRRDAKYGNFVYKYDINNNLLTFKTIKRNIVSLTIDFPYLKEEIEYALNNKQPICFGYKIKYDRLNRKYIVFTASFDRCTNKYFNNDISTGIVAIDINFGHIDLTNIDQNGNLKDVKTIYFKITNNKNQNELNLRKAINEVGQYVSTNKKILAKENLNLQKLKDKCKYQRKDYNKMLHSFPFSKIDDFINYEASKYEFEIINVGPSYTSIIGKYKYAGPMKLNTHISASFVIGRRALGFNEKLPKDLKPLLPNKYKTSKLNIQWKEILKPINKLSKKTK